MPSRRRTFLSSGIVTLCGCSAVGQREGPPRAIDGPARWDTYGRDATHQGSYAGGSIPSEAPSADESFELSGSIATSPVASDDILAVGDERGVFVVPFADQELPRWVELPGSVAGTPCLDGRTIYVTSNGQSRSSETASVLAMTPDGETEWRTDLSADVVYSPTVRDGTVFVRSGENYLALDAASGEKRWEQPARTQFDERDLLSLENFGPAVGRDVVVFPDPDGVTATDLADGTVRWQHRLEMVRSCPVLADGTAYVADRSTGLHAFDAATGTRNWSWRETGCWSPPALSNGTVYVSTSGGHHIVALAQQTGDLKWRTRAHGLHGSVRSGISVVGDAVLASSGSLGLVAVNTDSSTRSGDPGTKDWYLDNYGYNTPIVVDDRIIYVQYSPDGPRVRTLR